MSKTRMATAFERARWAVVAGALLLGCASNGGGTSGETHFQCTATSDCAVHGAGYACIERVCQPEKATGGTGGAIDAGGPPPQGAITLKISPAPGQVCQHTNGQLSMPASQNASVASELLSCDLAQNCKPDEFVVVDGDRETSITCSISPSGENFDVSLTLDVQGIPSMQFQANGVLLPNGGTLAINESNSVSGGGGSDAACAVSIMPIQGVIGTGKIWAQFRCTMFRDPNDLADTGCDVQGAFLFENCSG